MTNLVIVGQGEERKERIEWLKANGYEGNIEKDYPYSVIIIRYHHFFGGNVTCFAAHTSHGGKVISWEDWKKLIEK